MRLGRVIGSIWATQKDPSLASRRMVLVQPLRADGSPSEAALPFVDVQPLTATDATIVGVVDEVTLG